MRRGLGVILAQILRYSLCVNAAIFNLYRNVVLKMHHHGVEDAAPFFNIQFGGLLGARLGLFEHQHLAAVLMISRVYLIGNTADFKQRRLTFGLRHESANPLQAHQKTFIGQFAQRPVDGHPAKTKLRHQFGLGRNTIVRAPDTGSNFFADSLLHLFVERRRRARLRQGRA